MNIKDIDFTKPLLFEDEAETRSIHRLATITGGTVATIRRWMYQEGLIPHYECFA